MARALYVATATARRLKTRHIRPTNGRWEMGKKEPNQSIILIIIPPRKKGFSFLKEKDTKANPSGPTTLLTHNNHKYFFSNN